eukprot:759438-Hanusia_phi.AAC.7
MEAREQQKEKEKAEHFEFGKSIMKNYQDWKQEMKEIDLMKQKRILDEKKEEERILKQSIEQKKMRELQEKKEEKALMEEYRRQVELERIEQIRKAQEKAAEYQRMLQEKDVILERKRQAKEHERQENFKLFQLQLVVLIRFCIHRSDPLRSQEMSEKQEMERLKQEQIRQERLKKAERMAGELNNRAAEMDHELEMRIQKAQEEFRNKEMERETAQKLKKKHLEQETHRALDAQMTCAAAERKRGPETNGGGGTAAHCRAIPQRGTGVWSAAAVGISGKAAEEKEDQRRSRATAACEGDIETLPRLVEASSSLWLQAKQERDVLMSKAELQINSDLLRKVVEKLPEAEVPSGFVESLNESQGER